MRFVGCLFTLFLAVPAFGRASSDGSSRESSVRVGSSCLNVRSKASFRSSVQNCLRSSSTVQVISYKPGGYSKVMVNGRTGYVYSKYISPPRTSGPSSNIGPSFASPITGGSNLRLPPSNTPANSGGALTAASAKVQWGTSAERQRWTAAALAAIRANWSKLQNGRDVESFCPGYSRSSRSEKENCWLLIVGALVKRESNFKPGTTYPEGAPLFYNSVGLLQLSHNSRARECTPEGARSERDLKNPELNLRCGIRILARLVGSRGRIAGRAGAGAYWSVLRNPGEHRAAKANGIRSEASNLFRTQVAGRFPDRAIAGVPAEAQTAMR